MIPFCKTFHRIAPTRDSSLSAGSLECQGSYSHRQACIAMESVNGVNDLQKRTDVDDVFMKGTDVLGVSQTKIKVDLMNGML